MVTTPAIKQYIFLRGRVPNPSEMLEDEGIVAEASGIPELKIYLDPENLTPYADRVGNGHNELLRSGNLNREDIPRIAELARQRVESYWGVELSFPIQLLQASDMLEAERQVTERLNKELAKLPNPKRSAIPILPSTSFLDHMKGGMVLSDQYVVLSPKGGKSTYPGDVYFTGEAETLVFPWNEGMLRAVVANDMGNFASRVLRGETGDGYLRMLAETPEIFVTGINHVIRAAASYALPKALNDGGIPVLYRRILDIFSRDETQMFYAAMKALADDMGVKTACLFDGLYIGPSSRGVVVLGALSNRHPNYGKKDAAIGEAAKDLKYSWQSTVIPEAAYRMPRG